MGENSAISWTDHTWNPWIGCQKVSPACDGCYAEAMMATRYGRVEWGGPGKGSGTRVRTGASVWNDPHRWNRKALAGGTHPFVFCASLADIFDNQVDPAWRRDAFAVMRATPAMVYLLLTKRPQLIARLAEEAGGLPSNAALGTTVEDQTRADMNVPALVLCGLKPLFFFVSCEPLLGPVDLTNVRPPAPGVAGANFLWKTSLRLRIDWVITGGETDQGQHKARPTHPDWARALRDQCAGAGVAYHHKQNGEWLAAPEIIEAKGSSFHQFGDGLWVQKVGKKASGRLLDGVEHNSRPPPYRPSASVSGVRGMV